MTDVLLLTDRVIDRADWPAGEWDSEPDYLSWTDERTGLPCLIVRNRLGALCGYVAVEPGHPAFEMKYDDVLVDVHGGLTYSDHCHGRICHVPEPGKPDHVWWLGFDCSHSGDLEPFSLARGWSDGGRYRNVSYVKGECASLARQLKEMA